MRTAPIRELQRSRKKGPFLFGDCSWGYDMSCGWKEGLGWGKEFSEKGSVKQTSASHTQWPLLNKSQSIFDILLLNDIPLPSNLLTFFFQKFVKKCTDLYFACKIAQN